MAQQFYKIVDKNGNEMPGHYSGRNRTYEEAKNMVDKLNENGEHRPYTMTGTQQTAVEWLKNMLEWNYGDPQMLEITWANLDDLFERAKQMEKEQIMKAVYDSMGTNFDPNMGRAELYYNETYKKDQL